MLDCPVIRFFGRQRASLFGWCPRLCDLGARCQSLQQPPGAGALHLNRSETRESVPARISVSIGSKAEILTPSVNSQRSVIAPGIDGRNSR